MEENYKIIFHLLLMVVGGPVVMALAYYFLFPYKMRLNSHYKKFYEGKISEKKAVAVVKIAGLLGFLAYMIIVRLG